MSRLLDLLLRPETPDVQKQLPRGSYELPRLSELYGEPFVLQLKAVPYGRALEPAFDSIRGGGSLSLFEKLCDNALVAMLDEARTIPFGMEPMAAYLAGKESEAKAARIVMASKLAGAEPQQITERLRETYG